MSFEVDANDFLGNDYNDHIARCFALALSDPKTFYTIRANITRNLKRDVVTTFYKMIFTVLSTGDTTSGTSVYRSEGGGIPANFDKQLFKVQYPKQKINNLALSIVATIDDILNNVTDIIMPDKISKAVEEKLANMGKASVL